MTEGKNFLSESKYFRRLIECFILFSSSAGWGGIFDSHGKLVDCSDCSLTPNQFSTGGLLNVCTNCATGTTCNVKTGDFTSW